MNKTIIKWLLFVPSFWLGLWVGGKISPLFINGLVGLQWITITGIALFPIIFLSSKILKNLLWYITTISILTLLHYSINYYDQKDVPLQKGMTIEQVKNILGKSMETISQGHYARMPGVSFASFKITNVCEIFSYEDGVLYVYFNNQGKVEHIYKGKT